MHNYIAQYFEVKKYENIYYTFIMKILLIWPGLSRRLTYR